MASLSDDGAYYQVAVDGGQFVYRRPDGLVIRTDTLDEMKAAIDGQDQNDQA